METRCQRLLKLALSQTKESDPLESNKNDGQEKKRINVISDHVVTAAVPSSNIYDFIDECNEIKTYTSLTPVESHVEEKRIEFLNTNLNCNSFSSENSPYTYGTENSHFEGNRDNGTEDIYSNNFLLLENCSENHLNKQFFGNYTSVEKSNAKEKLADILNTNLNCNSISSENSSYIYGTENSHVEENGDNGTEDMCSNNFVLIENCSQNHLNKQFNGNDTSVEKSNPKEDIADTLNNNLNCNSISSENFPYIYGTENSHVHENRDNGTEGIYSNDFELLKNCSDNHLNKQFNSNDDSVENSDNDLSDSDSDLTFVASETYSDGSSSSDSYEESFWDKRGTEKKVEKSNLIKTGTIPRVNNFNCKENQSELLNEFVYNNSKVAISRRKSRIWDKRDFCPFCYVEITHFARHMERNHKEEPKVKKILSLAIGSTERKDMWNCLRKEGNFHLFKEEKKVVAVRRPAANETGNAKDFDDFAVCESCKGVYKKKTLYRHANVCPGRVTDEQKRGRLYALTQSQTFLAAARCQNDFLLKSRLKNEVFCIMRPDDISAVAKNDVLICLYGETHLKKHKREQIVTVTSNKMRELARLLIALRNITPVKNLIDAMKPEYFDDLVTATKVISGFNPENKTFKASSLALHMGTNLKHLCDIIGRCILKKSSLFSFENAELERKNIKSLHKLIESSWANEIASLALKDITEKHWEKPQIIPVTSDIIKFNNYVKDQVENASIRLDKIIKENTAATGTDEKELTSLYKILTKGIMALVLVLNRKRIGEIQYLKMSTYLKSFSDPFNQEEILKSLSVSEKIVCKNFKRIVSGGKGSKPVPILFSPFIQQKIDFMLQIRKKINGISKSSDYLFANPDSSKGWFHGTSVIRSLAFNCGAKNPSSLTSTKFRKQTATILQVMNINESDMEQLAIFMGHTKKTHEEWYRLPQDVYQIAKIAKLLLMIDKGDAHKYQGKGLQDIIVEESDCLEIEREINTGEVTEKSNKNSVITDISESEGEEVTVNLKRKWKTTENFEKQDISRNDFLETDIQKKVKANSNKENEGIELDIQSNNKNIKKIGSRLRWKEEEKSVMCKYFAKFIKNKKVPKKGDVEEFKTKEKQLFGSIDWVRIKTFVYNQYRD